MWLKFFFGICWAIVSRITTSSRKTYSKILVLKSSLLVTVYKSTEDLNGHESPLCQWPVQKGRGVGLSRSIHPSEFLVSSDVRLSSSLTFCNDVWFLSYEIEHFEFPEQELIPMCRDCRVIIFRFDGNTQWQMILLLNGRHVGISPKGTNMESPHKIWLKHFSENAGMNDRTDLNRGKVDYISIIFYISASWFNLLNGLR